MFEFKLPDLGEGIHEGEILKWYVKVGDTIAEDDPLIDVETDKAAVTIPSPKAGAIQRLGGEVGDTIEVGAVIAVVDTGSGAGSPSKPAAAPVAETKSPEAEARTPSLPPRTASAGENLRLGPVPAAPVVRRKAREMGIDLHQIPGSGPAGRVTAEDLERFATGGGVRAADEESAAAGTPSPSLGAATGIPYLELEAMPDFSRFGPVETQPVRSIRRKVARKMVTSMVIVPHVALMDDVDVSQLEAYRSRERQRRKTSLSLLPFVVKAVAECLQEFPVFNASLDSSKEEIIFKKFYNIGFAADTPKGLMVPVVRDADRRSILEISGVIERLAGAARDSKIQVADLQGGTFTITNVGPITGTRLIPTINHPEVAILGMGRAQEQPVVREGEIVIRTILPLTLTFDHRITDGANAARFMKRLGELLSSPLTWLLER